MTSALWKAGIIVLCNAALLVLAEMVLGRVFRVLFPNSDDERLEGHRSPMTWRELYTRMIGFFLPWVAVNTALIIWLIVK